jgi:hypothetical protein
MMTDSEIERWSPVVLALARELWVVRDRVRVMEALLVSRGTLTVNAIDQYQPSAEQQTRLDQDCEVFLGQLLAQMRSGSRHE